MPSLLKFAIAAVIAVVLVLFLGFLVRELFLDFKVRRAGKQCRHADQPIRREYSIKDSPAWQRKPMERTLALNVTLRAFRELGE